MNKIKVLGTIISEKDSEYTVVIKVPKRYFSAEVEKQLTQLYKDDNEMSKHLAFLRGQIGVPITVELQENQQTSPSTGGISW